MIRVPIEPNPGSKLAGTEQRLLTEKHRQLFFFAVFALVFYLVGASFVESFANYRTWKLVGSNEFAGYYHELASRIVKLMVLPGVLESLRLSGGER
jgi:hypothetical protein